MKKIYLIYCLLCAGAISSCDSQKPLVQTIKTITLQENHDGCSFDTEYLRLKIPSDIIIGQVDQIGNTDQYLFILQNNTAHRGLYVFDLAGRYITKIGNFGRGNGEYTLPLSFTIGTNTITVLDCGTNYALHYNAETFAYINRDKIFNTSYFEWINDREMVCSNEEQEQSKPFCDKQYVVTDRSFKPLSGSVDKIIQSGYETGPNRPMYKYDGRIRAYIQHLPYIYEFTETGATPVYEIQFGRFQQPSAAFLKQISSNGRDYYDDLINSGKISYYSVFETPDDILIYFIADHKKHLSIYSKKKDAVYSYDQNDFHEIVPCSPLYISGTLNDHFVVPLFISELREQQHNAKLPQELHNIIDTSSDNELILFLFKLD